MRLATRGTLQCWTKNNALEGDILDELVRLRDDFDKFKEDNKKSHERIYGRVEELERQAPTTELQFRTIMDTLKDIKNDYRAIKKDIDDLKGKPGLRWESLTQTLMLCLGTGILTFFLTRFLGG